MIAVFTAADASVAVAVIAAVASVLAARWANTSRKQTKTSNGHTSGEILEELRDDVKLLKLWWTEHLREHANRES